MIKKKQATEKKIVGSHRYHNQRDKKTAYERILRGSNGRSGIIYRGQRHQMQNVDRRQVQYI